MILKICHVQKNHFLSLLPNSPSQRSNMDGLSRDFKKHIYFSLLEYAEEQSTILATKKQPTKPSNTQALPASPPSPTPCPVNVQIKIPEGACCNYVYIQSPQVLAFFVSKGSFNFIFNL